MPLILGTNSIKDTGYDVDNSCRFNSGDSAKMSKTIGTPTSNRKFTVSCWVKLAKLGTQRSLWGIGSSDASGISVRLQDDDTLDFFEWNGSGNTFGYATNQKFRDVAAWYNFCFAVDTEQVTAHNRVRIYLNGTEIDKTNLTDSPGDPTQNVNLTIASGDTFNVADDYSSSNEWDGYIAEFVYIDGLQLDPTSFGEFDEDSGIWKPIDVSGLTFGTNGFYLDFENSGSLGADVSGNGNNFTVNNLTAIDQSTDTCTNNFATLNSLDSFYADSTFSEGNLKIVTEASLYSYNTSTIGLTQGKWYCEVFIETSPHPTTKDSMIGIAGRMSEGNDNFLGQSSDTYGIYGGNGNIYNNGGNTSYGVSHTTNDIIGIYMDLDNNKLYFAKNGILMNSGTGKDIISASSTKAGAYFMVADDFGNGYQGTYRLNFGSPIYSLTSGNTDANGYGNFEYDPSAGTFDGSSKDFYALNTKNLAEYG